MMDHTTTNPDAMSTDNPIPAGATGPDAEMDALYDAFLPTLIAARRSYARKRVAALLLLPIVLIAGAAWAGNGPDANAGVAQLATEAPEVEAPEPEVPEDEAPATPEQEGDDAQGEDVATDDGADAGPTVEVVNLGFAGSAVIHITDDGLTVAELALEPGWKADVVSFGGRDAIVIVLANGDVTLLATITPDLEVELEPIGTEENEPEIQTRKEIEVGDVGRVVVERDEDKLFMAVLWQHEWYEAVVVTEQGPRVYAYFTNDGVKHHVEAWIDGAEIAHGVWVTEPEPEPTPKPKEKDEPTEEDKPKEEEDEPEIQTRKEIEVGEVARVVVEREGETLWLGVLWHHEYYDAVVVSGTGAEVHAYFTNDGFEHHVRAWIKGHKIKHETWVVEPEIEAYDGSVTCGFGNVGVLVEGNIARVMSVQEVEGVEWVIVQEVGEVVRVRFITEEEVWIMEAWGNGEDVVAECGQVE